MGAVRVDENTWSRRRVKEEGGWKPGEWQCEEQPRGGTQQIAEPSVAQQEVTVEQGDKGGSTGSNGPEQ